MDDFPVVDRHHHLWDLQRFSYPWLSARPLPASVAGDVAPIAKPYLLDDYLADAARQNVVKSVHVDAGFDPSQPVAETRWLQSIANRHGFPHGVVARAKLHRPDVETMLAAHCRFPNVRGIRHIVNWHPDPAKTYVTKPDFLTDPAWLRGFARLKRYNLSFDLQLYPSQMADAAALAAAHGDTSMILNHAGVPVDRGADALSLWRAGMRALAAQPNVWVKISGWTGAGRKTASARSCWRPSRFSGLTAACSPAISRSTSSTAASMCSTTRSKESSPILASTSGESSFRTLLLQFIAFEGVFSAPKRDPRQGPA
jgi:predicted TIM-barrel fold metal-dependent hydrolase